jgi:hypothetical protein
MVATEKVCARRLTPQAAWVHQIHTAGAGGASSATTMVMMFGRLFVLLAWFLTLDTSDRHVLPTF